MPRTSKTVWRKDRITAKIDPATGRRVVNLPTIAGWTPKFRDAVFSFEASNLGTLRATVRMEKRAHGTDLGPIPFKLNRAGIPVDLASAYPDAE